jgi:hypothetical protein
MSVITRPDPKFPPWLRTAALVAIWVLLTVIFAVAYTQSPLYEGNQNTKFLHGLAMAGQGNLKADWLANTADPLPLFTYLVYATSLVDERLFYLYYVVLMGIYVFSVMGILSTIYKEKWALNKQVLFFALFLWVHARWAITRIEKRYDFNIEFLQNGVAGQYLLGIEFQNSAFGVLLLLSIFAFLKKRYYLAALCLGVATLLHSAYIFSAALITIAYLLLIFWDNLQATQALKERSASKILQAAKQPFLLGIFTSILVLPVLWYNQVYLAGTTAQASAQALDILVHYRIPHHAVFSSFWDVKASIQLGIMVIGLLLAYRSPRLFTIMLSLFTGGLLVSLVQVLMDNNSLALMAPWRVSVLLVPLSVSLILAFLVSGLIDLLHLNHPRYLLIIAPIALYIIFINVRGGNTLQNIYGTGSRERKMVEMMNFVKTSYEPGDVYLIPATDASFDDFRLFTGVPILITWKSHPYKDVEVLDWYKRVEAADRFYKAPPGETCPLLADLVAKYSINHVVLKGKEAGLSCDFTAEIYRESRYSIYAIDRP